MIFFDFRSIINTVMKMNKNTNNDGYSNSDLPKIPETPEETRLFPDDFMANAASATECTGLIQVSPAEDFEMTYDDIYSYRQRKPMIKEEDIRGHKNYPYQ